MKRSGFIPRHTRLHPTAPGKTRQPAKGSGGLRPLKVIPRKPIKAKKRSAAEYARIYGSEARVLWVQSLPCVGCGANPSENAHTVSGGKSRKADAATIAPLCGEDRNGCHAKYDQHQPPFDQADRRAAVKLHAAFTNAQWVLMGERRREA